MSYYTYDLLNHIIGFEMYNNQHEILFGANIMRAIKDRTGRGNKLAPVQGFLHISIIPIDEVVTYFWSMRLQTISV